MTRPSRNNVALLTDNQLEVGGGVGVELAVETAFTAGVSSGLGRGSPPPATVATLGPFFAWPALGAAPAGESVELAVEAAFTAGAGDCAVSSGLGEGSPPPATAATLGSFFARPALGAALAGESDFCMIPVSVEPRGIQAPTRYGTRFVGGVSA